MLAGLLFLFLCDVAFPRNAEPDSLAFANGMVRDGAFSNGNLAGASVLLYTNLDGQTDSTFTLTDYDGCFRFKNIKPQKVRLKIFFLGYETIDGYYDLEAGSNAFFFKMNPRKEELKSAKVTGDAVLMKRIKDTTIYNTAALHTSDSESVSAILEQLPGFKVTEKGITIDGEPVKRTYVNGTLVFGDNTLAAVDALKANEVSQIKVFDEQNAVDKRRGLKNSKKDKALDIVTKEAILSLAEAGASLQGGSDDTGQPRYSGAIAGSFFSEMLQFNATALGSNISNGAPKFESVNSFLMILNSERLTSYKENTDATINFTKYWKDRNYGNSLSSGYTYSHRYSRNKTNTLTSYFRTTDNPKMSMSDSLSGNDVIGSHDFFLNIDLKDTPLKSVRFGVEGVITDKNESSLNTDLTVTEGTSDEIRRREETGLSGRDCNLFSYLAWTDNDIKKFRPDYLLNVSLYNNSSTSWTEDTLKTSFNRRQLSSDGNGKGADIKSTLSINNTLINNEQRTLILSAVARTDYERTRKEQLTLNSLDVLDPVTDLANTYDFTWNSLSNKLSGKLDYNTKHLSVNAEIGARNEILMDDEFYPSAYSAKRVYWTVEPDLKIKYRNYNLEVHYGSVTPSLEQTRNRISDTNPLVLTGGNPNLRKSQNIKVLNIWNIPLGSKGYKMRFSVGGTSGFDDIVTKTNYFTESTILEEWDGYAAKAGSILHSFENSDKMSWEGNASIGGAGIHCKRKVITSWTISTSFSNNHQYTGSEMEPVFRTSGKLDFMLRFRPNKTISLTANPSIGYDKYSGSGSDPLSENVHSSLSLQSNFIIAKNGYVGEQFYLQSYSYTQGAGSDYLSKTLSVHFGWRFFKGSLNVKISCNDLLNSGSLYSSLVTANSMTQVWTPYYGRYYYLSFLYIFRRKS